MKFIIQKESDYFEYDFCYELFNAIKYQEWIGNNIKYEIINKIDISSYDNTYIPCGSVEFVSDYMQQISLPIPKPRNVPVFLRYYAGRNMFNISKYEINSYKNKRLFIKSNDTIKGISGIISEIENIPDGNYQISSIVEILSEWRCFVYKKQIVGLQNYEGDFLMFPGTMMIHNMMIDFIDQPIAYTLDIFIDEDFNVWCLEVHDFFSCGLYGFRNYKILPFMFSNWWDEYKERNK